MDNEKEKVKENEKDVEMADENETDNLDLEKDSSKVEQGAKSSQNGVNEEAAPETKNVISYTQSEKSDTKPKKDQKSQSQPVLNSNIIEQESKNV